MVPFYATRERRRKKREAREHAHVRGRVCAWHGVCTRRKRTYVQKESRELGRRDKDGERKGEDGSCVCTSRRVYQATSVVTAIVPTTSPAGRHPRSYPRLSSFPSRPSRSSTFGWVSSPSPERFLPRRGERSYPPTFLLEFLASRFLSPPYLRCDKRLYFRAKSEFLGDEFSQFMS